MPVHYIVVTTCGALLHEHVRDATSKLQHAKVCSCGS
jgi:hypothetical protein